VPPRGVGIRTPDRRADRVGPAGMLSLTIHRSSICLKVYEAYLAERQRTSKKIFKSTFSKLRKLDRDAGATSFEFDAKDPQALGVLMRSKWAQYRRTASRVFPADPLDAEEVLRCVLG